MKIKIRWRDVLGLGISGVLLWYTVRHSDADIAFMLNNKQAWLYFCTAQLLFLLSLYLKSLSFKLYFADTYSRLQTVSSFPSIMLANFYSTILPGNMGDAVRVYHFSRKNKQPLVKTIGALITEKINIGLMLGTLLLLFSLWQLGAHGIAPAKFIVLLIAVLLVLSVLFAVIWQPRYFLRLVPFRLVRKWLFKIICHIRWQYQRLIQKKILVPYLCIIITLYVTTVAIKYILFETVTLPPQVTTFDMAWYYTFVAMLAMFVPSAPSSLGVVHYSIYYAVTQACVERNITLTPAIKEAAFALSVWFHLSYVMPDLIIGSFMIIKERKVLYGKRID